jgi:hypothetical protein
MGDRAMNLFRLLVLVLALIIAAPAGAQWQTPDHSVPIGRGGGFTGFDNAAPGTAGRPLVSNGATADPSFQALPNSGLTQGGANTFKGSLNGTTTLDLPLVACTAVYQLTQWIAGTGWQCSLIPVLPSRAAAATLNLAAFDAVTTLGYSTPGDGGEATFKKVGSDPLIDSFITTFSITGGSGYTNGSYFGNLFAIGTKPYSIGTVTVTGGSFSAVDISGTPGNLCAVGDVLPFIASAAAVGGVNGGMPAGGAGGSITVTGCSAPLGSFIDAGSARFQIVTPNGANAFQFGAKGDWNGTDASATDNFSSLQALFWYAGFKSSFSFDAGGFWGGIAHVPQGAFMACGTGLKPLVVPNGVRVMGAHGTASSIKFCTAWNAGVYQVTLGDNNWHFACFNPSLYHLALRSDSGTEYMVYSSCGQDHAGLYQVYIYSNGPAGTRPCIHYEKGFGGATVFVIRDIACSVNSNKAQIWIGNTIASGMNLGTTMVEITNVSAGANSGPTGNHQTQMSLLIQGGFVNVNRYHFEATAGGIVVDVGATGNGEHITIQNVNGGGLPGIAPCLGTITLQSTNTPGNTTISQVQGASAACSGVTILNGQSSGVNYTTAVRGPTMCVSGACAAAVP